MAFLNPAALWGLLAIAVPVIVHFFNLQRPRQILFSNVAFVREVKRTVVRRVNFQRWLLLALRILAIAAAVLMFADPVQISDDRQLLQGTRSVVVVIDNSESMKSDNERGEYFRQAISLSRNLIKAYQQEDEFLVTGTSNLSLQSGFIGKDEILDQLENLSIDQNTRSIGDILAVTPGLFGQAVGAVRELYVISDFQQSTILADSSQLIFEDSSVAVKLVPVATRQPDNVYIADHTFESQILTSDNPANLSLTLVNSGENSILDVSVRVVLEGNVVAISNHSVDAGERKPVELSFIPGNSGWLNGHIEIDDNPIDFDNKRYFSFYVPEKEKVLIIGSDASSESRIRLLYEEVFTQVEPVFVSERSLGSITLADYRSVVFDGLSNVSSGLSSQIQSYLAAGGSVMVFPDEDASLGGVNSLLGSLNAGQIQESISVEDGIEMRTYDLGHPVFSGMFTEETDRAKADIIRVFQYYPFQLSGRIQQTVIMEMENGLPFLTEHVVGSGRLFWFSVNASDSWTDLQVKTIFPPLMYRITQIMNQTGSLSLDQEIGAFSPLEIKASAQKRLDLRGESGDRFTPERYEQGAISRLVFDNMSLSPGSYDIVQEDSVLAGISFNISDEESDLKFSDASAMEVWVKQQALSDKVEILPPAGDVIADKVVESREGTPLWTWFLWLVLICLLVEVLVLGGRPGKIFRKPTLAGN